jgi:hypothetical protein
MTLQMKAELVMKEKLTKRIRRHRRLTSMEN